MILINAASKRPGEAPLRRLTPGTGTVVVPRTAGRRTLRSTAR
jgi:hypothetical protein